MRFLASEAGKQMLLQSPSPAALPLLQRFHPDAVGQYHPRPAVTPAASDADARQPQTQVAAYAGGHRAISVTGCGTASGTVMNNESAIGAVAQGQPSVDFLLSELGAGKDLVAETALDAAMSWAAWIRSPGSMYIAIPASPAMAVAMLTWAIRNRRSLEPGRFSVQRRQRAGIGRR